jgi:hypothetical protein
MTCYAIITDLRPAQDLCLLDVLPVLLHVGHVGDQDCAVLAKRLGNLNAESATVHEGTTFAYLG